MRHKVTFNPQACSYDREIDVRISDQEAVNYPA